MNVIIIENIVAVDGEQQRLDFAKEMGAGKSPYLNSTFLLFLRLTVLRKIHTANFSGLQLLFSNLPRGRSGTGKQHQKEVRAQKQNSPV